MKWRPHFSRQSFSAKATGITTNRECGGFLGDEVGEPLDGLMAGALIFGDPHGAAADAGGGPPNGVLALLGRNGCERRTVTMKTGLPG